jgi:di/tricarboxylate transporter
MFAVATVLAANCSFATPIGHQVHLLVMGPGHYRFADYVKAGTPLVILLWLTFVLAAKILWQL